MHRNKWEELGTLTVARRIFNLIICRSQVEAILYFRSAQPSPRSCIIYEWRKNGNNGPTLPYRVSHRQSRPVNRFYLIIYFRSINLWTDKKLAGLCTYVGHGEEADDSWTSMKRCGPSEPVLNFVTMRFLFYSVRLNSFVPIKFD